MGSWPQKQVVRRLRPLPHTFLYYLQVEGCNICQAACCSIIVRHRWSFLDNDQFGATALPTVLGVFCLIISNKRPGSLSAICRSSPFASCSVKALMSAWKDDEEEVPPSKIALKMVNVLVSMICGWYVKIGCWGPRSMVVVCGIFLFYVACTSFWCFSK